MAAKKDLLIFQGDDHTWTLTIRHVDRSDPLNPVYTPYNLDDYTLASHIRADYADEDTTVDAEMIFDVVDAAAGVVNMVLDSESSSMLSGRYRWDLQIVRNADDYVTTLLYGVLKVQQEVTRE